MSGLTHADYKEALNIQDACNLSGVVHAFSRMINKIWDEARKLNKGTEWVNNHPIAILFTEKCAHLSTGEILTGEKINEAWKECERKSNGEK